MDENGVPEPLDEDETIGDDGASIGGWTGFRSLIIGLYQVGGIGLVVTVLARGAWSTLRGWFRKG